MGRFSRNFGTSRFLTGDELIKVWKVTVRVKVSMPAACRQFSGPLT